MSDRWTDLISEYLDGCMEPAARRDMEAHLLACAECSATLEDLRGIVARASSLPAPAPTPRSGRASRRDSGPPRPRPRCRAAGASVAPHGREWRLDTWRVSFTLPQLAAACVAVIALSGGLAFLATRTRPTRIARPFR